MKGDLCIWIIFLLLKCLYMINEIYVFRRDSNNSVTCIQNIFKKRTKNLKSKLKT